MRSLFTTSFMGGDSESQDFRFEILDLTLRDDAALLLVVVADNALAAGEAQVVLGHPPRQLLEGYLRLPAEVTPGLGGVAEQEVDFGRAEVAGVDLDVLLPVEVEQAEHLVEELADAVGLAG